MAYRFNGTSDFVRFDAAPLVGFTFGPLTFACLFKRNALSTYDELFAITTSGGTEKAAMFATNSDVAALWRGSFSNGPSVNSTSLWYLLVITAASSGATPRFHLHNGTSWAHSNGSAGANTGYAPVSGDRLWASLVSGGNPVAGDFVCMGVKKSDSADLTVETLTPTAFSTWRSFGFDWLIGFDSSLVSGGLLQDQASPGTGDETARSGTSLVSDPAGWAWTSFSTWNGSSSVSLTDTVTSSGHRKVTGASTVAETVAVTTSGIRIAGPATVHGASSVSLAVQMTARGVVEGSGHTPISGGGRVQLAFTDDALVWEPAWTSLDSDNSLVASYTIDRGRVYELDQTDGGRATVDILDRDGILDPTRIDGPYYGHIKPLVQCRLQSWNPITETMMPRFRGWVSDWNYDFDPSQQVNRLRLELTDLFEILGAIDMIPGHYGSTPPAQSAGQVYYPEQNMDDRILAVLDDAGIPDGFAVVFSGNVKVKATVYSPGENPLSAIQEAADAELPGVSNAYTDSLGRLAVHGRLAKFDPAGVLAGADPGAWNWHHWKAGDGAAVQADLGQVAQLREFSYSLGVSKIINSALATPAGIADTAVAGQVVRDTASITTYGTRSWSAQELLTKEGLLDGASALVETKRFAQYYVDNYAQPRHRVEGIGFRTIRPGAPGAQITWRLLTEIDISDRVDVWISSPGGGGFSGDPYYVEGIHETVEPLSPFYDNITITLDLSPKAYYDSNPFPS